MFGEIVESSRSGNDDVRDSLRVGQLRLVLFKRNTAEIASVSDLGRFEVTTYITIIIPSLLKSLKI